MIMFNLQLQYLNQIGEKEVHISGDMCGFGTWEKRRWDMSGFGRLEKFKWFIVVYRVIIDKIKCTNKHEIQFELIFELIMSR